MTTSGSKSRRIPCWYPSAINSFSLELLGDLMTGLIVVVDNIKEYRLALDFQAYRPSELGRGGEFTDGVSAAKMTSAKAYYSRVCRTEICPLSSLSSIIDKATRRGSETHQN